MEHFSLTVAPPMAVPFDRSGYQPGNWYDTFLGNVVLPVYETGKLDRFWFSQYGGFGSDHHAKFRFSTEHAVDVHAVLESLIAALALKVLPEHGHVYPHPFDIVGDLVPPHERSHFGHNQRNADRIERGDRLYSFLHSAAALTLHCLSHQDGEGRWYRESNPDTGNTHFGDTTESIHHLFCNLSSVPTAVCILPRNGDSEVRYQLLSPLYAKIANLYTPTTKVVGVMF